MSAAKVYDHTEKSLTSNKDPARYDNHDGGSHSNKKGKSVWSRVQLPTIAEATPAPVQDTRQLLNDKHARQQKWHERGRTWTPIPKTPAQVLVTEKRQVQGSAAHNQ